MKRGKKRPKPVKAWGILLRSGKLWPEAFKTRDQAWEYSRREDSLIRVKICVW